MITTSKKMRTMWRGGEWVAAINGGSFEVIDPATGECIANVPDGTAADAKAAIDAADDALESWAATAPEDRGDILRRASEQMTTTDKKTLGDTITDENGKPLAEALGEVDFAAGYFKWFAGQVDRDWERSISSVEEGRDYSVIRQPVGVVAAITPWNFPAAMITRKIAPALAAGCPVVLKPAEETPLTALEIGRVLEEVGLPPGVLNIVTTNVPAEIGRVFLNDHRVRKIGFTGSTEVGKVLLKGAAAQVKRVSLELGGNAPFIVFEDADLDEAVRAGVAIKYERVAGQSCICPNRFYIQEAVADSFIKKFVEHVGALKIGNGREPSVTVGPLINEAAFEKVDGLVQDAIEKGAIVKVGGKRRTDGDLAKGYFFDPTVLINVVDGRDGMRVCRDEVFGPVASIATFRTEEEVVRRANDTDYGLAAYVFTRDSTRSRRMIRALDSGYVEINGAKGYRHATPFGGFKESGLGREGGDQGIEDYTEVKSVIRNLG